MSASVWNPGDGNTTTIVNADNTYKSQYFIATEGQTVFNLTSFAYAPATESLFVFINGVEQIITKDYLESSGSAVTLTEAARLGDIIHVKALVGAEGAQAAAISAAQAAQSATDAQTAAASIIGVNNSFTASGTTPVVISLGTKTVTIPAGKQFINGQYILLVDSLDNTRYVSGQVGTYVGTNLTLNITKIRGAGTINSWNLSVSGIPETAPPATPAPDIFASDLMFAQVIATTYF